MDWLLNNEEIAAAHRTLLYSDNEASWIHQDRAVAKAQAKKLVEKFEEAGIYVVKDGRYLWNPQKFRSFWQALKKEVGL